ncbi:MAG: 2-keto-4-pentenoate hydratase [Rubrivivax sp.]|jgi:2-oxo-3-hexenedioate decarboxylase
MKPDAVSAVASRLMQAWDGASLATLPSSSTEGFDLPAAWQVASELFDQRQARGEVVAGWKIGFTNRSIWQRYGVHAPIWGPVWQGGLKLLDSPHAAIGLAGLCQPRLEPEIVFGLCATPRPDMSLQALQGCIEWVAHGFEIVHTHFEDWRFTAPDTVADFALHGRLLVGPRVPVAAFGDLAGQLSSLRLELRQEGQLRDSGQGAIVLDGPLQALQHWLRAMAEHTPHWRVQPGHVVTTGTLTDAWPLRPGQRWQTRLSEPLLSGLTLAIEP